MKQLDFTNGTEIELKTITGFSSKGTMKLKGMVKRKEVVVLIDSGAMHHFIHQNLVEEREILVEKGTQFGVIIDNGTRCKGRAM